MRDQAIVGQSGGKGPFDRLTRRSALMVLLCALPFFFLFAALGEPARGRAAATCVGMIATAVLIRWDLQKRAWFWVTIAILALLHIPVVLFIPWTNRNYPGIVLLPGALLDLAMVYGCIKLAEKLMGKKGGASPAD